MICPSCRTENRDGRKFCGECGASLAVGCPVCGTANEPGERFCGECGNPLVVAAAAPPVETPVAERRLVSVLFADLVGFTTASEQRDAEDTRELLTRYFELARTTIERYGGTVEKFIGDAVMAVWGAPVAQEDDAERAVRAALDLVGGVPDLDPALQARAGVLTGEAAVTLGAEGQGMVAGDLVNTASRIQSAAEPGTVLVGEATRRASEAAVVYEDGGAFDLKGKAEPVPVWRATRVVAARRGEGRSVGLEAPFVGRERELRLVKELFHATAEEGRAHLLSVVGIAGIGKSRLTWEFFKYIDGLSATAWWHKGRCLAYGDGVAYWALAEMIRMRARIAEDEAPEEALAKLRTTASEIVLDPEERALVEPRLQHLLGLTERTAADREDLFSAWRLFIERMADQNPVIMVFEDIQWADVALVEFLEYLLDWSRSHPISIVTLARPEIAQRHPGWGANLRNFTSLSLEPLSAEAVDALLRGLVPGLPDDALVRIRERADGIPLYAVETVRMLLDRGLLEPGDGGYRVTGDLGALDVPETLHALIAARLDGLEPAERRLLQDAAVLGKTFAPRGLAALGGVDEDSIRPTLASLVRKELLAVETDPRSPERGQYGFLQALVQRVARETLSRRDRRTKHLAAADYLATESGLEPDEIAEIIAAHLLDAFRAAPDNPDAGEIKGRARDWLARAGERAASLDAREDARRAFDAAVELADEPLERARLLERAGETATAGADPAAGEARLREARSLYEQADRTHDAARATAQLSLALWALGRGAEAIGLLDPALEVLAQDDPDEDVAALAAEAARIHHFQDNNDTAMERVELALGIAEGLALPAVLSDALNTKALLLKGRPNEARALLREALAIALDHGLVYQAIRAYNNLSVVLADDDRPAEARGALEAGFELARSRHRQFAISMGLGVVGELIDDGDWDAAVRLAEELPLGESAVASQVAGFISLAKMAYERGDSAAAERWLALIAPGVESSTDIQLRTLSLFKQSIVAMAEGRHADAIESDYECIRIFVSAGFVDLAFGGLEFAATAAVDLGDPTAALPVAALFDDLPAGRRGRMTELGCARIAANAAAAAGENDRAAEAFALALATARNVGRASHLGPVLVDYGRWLVATGRGDEAEPLLAEARELYERMGAVVWLERIDAIAPRAASVVS